MTDSIPPTSVLCKSRSSKSLKFSRRTKVYLIPSLAEYSEEEYFATWRGGAEDAEMQQDVVRTVRIMRQNNGRIPFEHRNELTSRGLEHLASPIHLQTRAASKERHYDAVLDEQDRQFDAGEDDQDKIAAISIRSTESCRNAAIVRGAEDAAAERPRPNLEEILGQALHISLGEPMVSEQASQEPSILRGRRLSLQELRESITTMQTNTKLQGHNSI